MQYKSYADLARDITLAAYRVPTDVDLIVGVPRSGMLAASVLGLTLNVDVCDLDAFCENRPLHTGATRRIRNGERVGDGERRAHGAAHVLVLDDSVASGKSLATVRERVWASGFGGRLTWAAVYCAPGTESQVDLGLYTLPLPRIFQWNLFHRREVERYCVDIDGVLCHDPLSTDNDDGVRYREFLIGTKPLSRPSYRIGHLVTSRLEKYRPETEQWLAAHGVSYGTLHMLDGVTADERRRLQLHGRFKAAVYGRLSDADLFIESETQQAREIARRSGKPVLDFNRHELVRPRLGVPLMIQKARKAGRLLRRYAERGRRDVADLFMR